MKKTKLLYVTLSIILIFAWFLHGTIVFADYSPRNPLENQPLAPPADIKFFIKSTGKKITRPRQVLVDFNVVGGARRFQHWLPVPTIRMQSESFLIETDHDTWFTVRLEAPAFYSWQTGGDYGAPVAGLSAPPISSFSRQNVNHTNNRDFSTTYENDRHVLYIRINTSVFAAQNPEAGAADINILDITNLRLYCDYRAKLVEQNIRVNVQVGTSASLSNAPWESFVENPTAANVDTLVLGHRGKYGRRLSVLGDVPIVQSGKRNIGDVERTVTLRLEEEIPGSWSMGYDSPIHFDLEAEAGVEIIGGTVHIFSLKNRASLPTDRATPRDAGAILHSYADVINFATADDFSVPNTHPNVFFTPDRVSINAPSYNCEYSQNRMVMEITFYLSVAPGFADKNGSADIFVTASGKGLENLIVSPDSPNKILIAQAQDTLSIKIPQGAISHPANPRHMTSATLNNIEITIKNPENIEVDDIFWLYLTEKSNISDLHLNQGATLIYDKHTGLILSPVGAARQPGACDGVFFKVLRAPHTTEPITITVSELTFYGYVAEGMEYVIVLSSNKATQNYHCPREKRDYVGVVGVGMYTGLPYSVGAVVGVEA